MPPAARDRLRRSTDILTLIVVCSFLFLAGVQYRARWMSVFGQAQFIPMHTDFLLSNGRGFNFGYEIGVRYNVGTAIDRNP